MKLKISDFITKETLKISDFITKGQRFYRGKNAKKDSIGIGLALAKAVVEGQNGVIGASNRVEGGACFEIRFYRH